MRDNTKSETIVKMRLEGASYEEIIKVVGGTRNAARVLFHKRRWKTSSLLASDKYIEWGDPNDDKPEP